MTTTLWFWVSTLIHALIPANSHLSPRQDDYDSEPPSTTYTTSTISTTNTTTTSSKPTPPTSQNLWIELGAIFVLIIGLPPALWAAYQLVMRIKEDIREHRYRREAETANEVSGTTLGGTTLAGTTLVGTPRPRSMVRKRGGRYDVQEQEAGQESMRDVEAGREVEGFGEEGEEEEEQVHGGE